MNKNKYGKLLKTRAWAEINLANIYSNINEFKKIIDKNCEIMAIVKADAYGFGAAKVTKMLQKKYIKNFGVATLKEAIQLREYGIKGDILVLGVVQITKDTIKIASKLNICLTVPNEEYASKLEELNFKVKVHIKVDTGMGRIGILSDRFEEILKIYKYSNISVKGIYSHLAVADSENEEDIKYTKLQITKFKKLISVLENEKIQVGKKHIHNSYGIINYHDEAFNMVRIGIGMYEKLDTSHTILKPKLKDSFTLKSLISQIKTLEKGSSLSYARTYIAKEDIKVATISIGYADGVSRKLSNIGSVLVNGIKVNIIGNICMDQMMIDVTDIPKIKIGDEVIILGTSNDLQITASDIADLVDTISYEVYTSISERVERVYTNI